MDICKEGIDELKKAIVSHTSADYLEIHRKLYLMDNYGKKYRKGENKTKTKTYYYSRDDLLAKLEDIMEFLYSDWFDEACGVNPNQLLDILDQIHDEWKAKYDRKIKEGG